MERRILVLGATGRTGRWIAEEALQAGHTVFAFGRSASATTVPTGAVPVAGDVLDPDALERALSNVDSVAVSLSIPRKTASPFAEVLGPPDLHSRSTAILLDQMQRAGVRRLVKLSAQGVGDSAPRTGWGFRAIVAISKLRIAFADHAKADQLVADSPFEWTILRPPRLDDGEPIPLRSGPDLATGTFTRVPRRAVARFAVDCLNQPETFWRVLTLSPGAAP